MSYLSVSGQIATTVLKHWTLKQETLVLILLRTFWRLGSFILFVLQTLQCAVNCKHFLYRQGRWPFGELWPTDFQQYMWIMLKLLGNEKLILMCIYRSTSSCTINNDNKSKLPREVSSSNKHKANLYLIWWIWEISIFQPLSGTLCHILNLIITLCTIRACDRLYLTFVYHPKK